MTAWANRSYQQLSVYIGTVFKSAILSPGSLTLVFGFGWIAGSAGE
jgi:hypothetical protein